MKPTPEQVAAAKAYARGTETPMQYAKLRGTDTAIRPNHVAEILIAALEAAEEDSARLDWLFATDTVEISVECSTDAGISEYMDIKSREAIDAARKAQP